MSTSECWALQHKQTKIIEKLFLFESRKEARDWCKDRKGSTPFKPVRVELLVIPGR